MSDMSTTAAAKVQVTVAGAPPAPDGWIDLVLTSDGATPLRGAIDLNALDVDGEVDIHVALGRTVRRFRRRWPPAAAPTVTVTLRRRAR